ncbi:MAG: DNA-processing protein DprA [Candidatus Dadabacteria bacterium]|nr:DNA-processing protein DprA [Candidatus Dadabacteria bacterium]
MEGDGRYWIALGLANGVGYSTIKILCARYGSAGEIFRAPERELASIEGVHPRAVEAIKAFSDWESVDAEFEKLVNSRYEILTLNDPGYPSQLYNIHGPPPYLLTLGKILPVDAAAIAIVGSRLPDRYGRTVTEALAGELAALGITIVSGMARGIDSIAQEEAIKKGGRTIAVLGSGIDVIYPPENTKLYESIAQNGAILSEFFMGSPPLPQNFPRRNRIVSGLSLGVVVVQASEKSGSLISASFALDQNREVFAVPGNVDRKLSRGPNGLIKKGAKLVETVDDILGEIDALRGLSKSAPLEAPAEAPPSVSGPDKAVYDALGRDPVHVDEIIRITGLDTPSVLSVLLSLELGGYALQHPGKFFSRRL